ncbi:MAG: hypothetical protein JNN00_19470 [Chitinophagaceae bacterium]|nr:hypothetical protein [Chitinophagaceae bacterium]
MNNQSAKPTVEQLINGSAKDIRGIMIENAVEIERMMEYYIGKCFCRTEEKITEMIMLIIAPMQFTQKKELFMFLITSHNKKFLNKHKSILSSAGSVIKHRNIFAHWSVDYSSIAEDDFVKKQVLHFVKLKRSDKAKIRKDLLYPDKETYSEKKINALIKESVDLNNCLRELLKWTNAPSK